MKTFKEFLVEGSTWDSISSELRKHKVFKNGMLRTPRTDGTYGVFYYHKKSGLYGLVIDADDKGFYYTISSGKYYLPYAAELVSSKELYIFKTRNAPKHAEKYILEKIGGENPTLNSDTVLENSFKE
tara:strand:+ start:88558 stop:88938 length:381 start_codon:yes stop_codon:yes gene_type:complete